VTFRANYQVVRHRSRWSGGWYQRWVLADKRSGFIIWQVTAARRDSYSRWRTWRGAFGAYGLDAGHWTFSVERVR
jgi:hypothetical protein